MPSEHKQYNLPETPPAVTSNIVYTGDASVVKDGSLKSPNYAPGTAGWSINSDGTAEFTGVTVDGYVVQSKGSFGGDGSDGALDTSSSAINIDLGNANVVTKNYTSVNIATNNLTFTNPSTNGTIVILKSQGNVVVSASIVASSLGGAGGAAGTATNVGFVGDGGHTTMLGRSNYGVGATVNTTDAGTSFGAGGAAITYLKEITSSGIRVACGAGGGGGAGGSTGAGAAGGRGGGAVIIECGGALNFSGTITTAGDVGSNSAGSAGGAGGAGGGGAGGSIVVLYKTLTANTGTLTVTGGAGGTGGAGTGTNDTGGGGGGGGHITAGANGTESARATGDGGNGGNGGNGQSLVAVNTLIA